MACTILIRGLHKKNLRPFVAEWGKAFGKTENSS